MIHRGGRGQSFVYELMYDPPPDANSKFLSRLIDVEQLRRQYDADLSGLERAEVGHVAGAKSGSSRGEVGVGKSPQVLTGKALRRPKSKVDQNANLDTEKVTS